MRDVKITRNYLKHPEGSVLIEFGDTKVICTASVETGVPPFLEDTEYGWITAEYGMLPRSTNTRNRREANTGKIGGRTAEIQRLIGRSLRSVTDTSFFPGRSILIDCDVIQADGGTRTASITGSCVALYDAMNWMITEGIIVLDEKNTVHPLKEWVAAVSVGIVAGELCLDLDFQADSMADTDMNIVMTESGKIVEIQGTAEKEPFSREELNSLVNLAAKGIKELITIQKNSVQL